MKRTGEEFKRAAIKKGIHNWPSHDCSICGYIVGWIFGDNHELVVFDHGCDCTGRRNHSVRTWDDVATNYNIQEHPDVIADMDKFWGFNEPTQQEVLDVVGEKWYVTYNHHGQQMMGLCNHHQAIPELISKIRASGGKNIVIVDQTIFFVEDEPCE